MAVAASDGDVVYGYNAAGQVGLYMSTDAGQSWEPLLSEVVTALAFDPADGDGVVAYAADGRGLIETRDGGQTWTELGLVLDEDAAGHMAVHPSDSATVYVGTYGADLLRTSDGR